MRRGYQRSTVQQFLLWINCVVVTGLAQGTFYFFRILLQFWSYTAFLIGKRRICGFRIEFQLESGSDALFFGLSTRYWLSGICDVAFMGGLKKTLIYFSVFKECQRQMNIHPWMNPAQDQSHIHPSNESCQVSITYPSFERILLTLHISILRMNPASLARP